MPGIVGVQATFKVCQLGFLQTLLLHVHVECLLLFSVLRDGPAPLLHSSNFFQGFLCGFGFSKFTAHHGLLPALPVSTWLVPDEVLCILMGLPSTTASHPGCSLVLLNTCLLQCCFVCIPERGKGLSGISTVPGIILQLVQACLHHVFLSILSLCSFFFIHNFGA